MVDMESVHGHAFNLWDDIIDCLVILLLHGLPLDRYGVNMLLIETLVACRRHAIMTLPDLLLCQVLILIYILGRHPISYQAAVLALD